MDAREQIAREIESQAWAALGIRDTLAYKNRRTSSLRKADRIIASLAADSRQIIHRDENHGPTLERAADRERELEDVLARVHQWCAAYPIDIFPEPDFKEARKLLAAGGITIDAISASNMRHVVNGIIKIIEDSPIRAMGEKK